MSSLVFIDDCDPTVQYGGDVQYGGQGSWRVLGTKAEFNSTTHGATGDGVLYALLTFTGAPPF
jgi:hypothetical protein